MPENTNLVPTTIPANFITVGKLIIQLIPFIIEAIKASELVFQDSPGKGVQKLEIVKILLQLVYEQVDQIWGPVQKIITAIVSAYNVTGVFKSSSVTSSINNFISK